MSRVISLASQVGTPAMATFRRAVVVTLIMPAFAVKTFTHSSRGSRVRMLLANRIPPANMVLVLRVCLTIVLVGACLHITMLLHRWKEL